MSANWGMLGNEWAVNLLRRQVDQHNPGHAYLFTGPAGVGRRTLALRFAQALNCGNPNHGDPCGMCWDCQQFQRDGRHPNLVWVESHPDPKKDGQREFDRLGNKAPGLELQVDDVRNSQQSLALRPFRSNYRVAGYLRFQEANANAGNALLKTLEETPRTSILILTADNPEMLLPTIVSRCELFRMQPVELDALEAWLQQQGADAPKARLLAYFSGGRPGFAVRLLQDPERIAFREERLRDLVFLTGANIAARFEYAEKLNKERERDRTVPYTVFALWLSFWRDVMLRSAGSTAPLANLDCEKDVETQSNKLGFEGARNLVQGLERSLDRLDGNVNVRLLLETTLMEWPA